MVMVSYTDTEAAGNTTTLTPYGGTSPGKQKIISRLYRSDKRRNKSS